MSSEVVRLSDVIEPEVYADYIIEESVEKTSLSKSGILYRDPVIDSKIVGGGSTFNLPHWTRPTGEPGATYSDKTIETKKIGTSKQVARRLMFDDGWSSEELAGALAGSSPMAAIESMVDNYWDVFFQKILFSTIKGVMADNADNDGGDLIYDIALSGGGTPAAANKISGVAVANTAKTMGDAGDDFTAIAMHSTPYWKLVENDLIETVKDSAGNIVMKRFMGLNLIVTDELGADTDGGNSIYWNILLKPASIAYGESANGITVVELDRNAPKSEDRLFMRRQFCMHPKGFKWVENSVATDMPTRSELEEPGNWDRVFNLKNCGFAILKTNG